MKWETHPLKAFFNTLGSSATTFLRRVYHICLSFIKCFLPLFCCEAVCPIRLLFWLLFCYRSASRHW